MTASRLRSCGAAPMAVLIAAVLAVLPPMAVSRVRKLIADIALLAGEDLGWIMADVARPRRREPPRP